MVEGKKYFTDQITILRGQIKNLERQIEGLEKELHTKRIDEKRMFVLTSEVVRLRRMMEYDGDAVKTFKKENEDLRRQLEESERQNRNMRRWMKFNGVEEIKF